MGIPVKVPGSGAGRGVKGQGANRLAGRTLRSRPMSCAGGLGPSSPLILSDRAQPWLCGLTLPPDPGQSQVNWSRCGRASPWAGRGLAGCSLLFRFVLCLLLSLAKAEGVSHAGAPRARTCSCAHSVCHHQGITCKVSASSQEVSGAGRAPRGQRADFSPGGEIP